jgi:hypothetical protein
MVIAISGLLQVETNPALEPPGLPDAGCNLLPSTPGVSGCSPSNRTTSPLREALLGLSEVTKPNLRVFASLFERSDCERMPLRREQIRLCTAVRAL